MPESVSLAQDPTGWGALWSSRQLKSFIILCTGIWLHATDTFIVATLMPSVIGEVGGVAYVNWTVALYQCGSIITGAAAGVMFSQYGLRAAFQAGAIVFAGGCAVSAFAPNIGLILLGRIVQGLGGGLMLGLIYLSVQLLFPKALWGRVYAVISAVWSVSALSGPLVGGIFAEAGLWRGAFWAFGAQALILVLLSFSFLEDRTFSRHSESAVTLSPLVFLTLAVLSIAGAGSLSTPLLSVPLGMIGLLLLVTCAISDRRSKSKMFPVDTLDIRTAIGKGSFMVFALSAGTTAFWTYGPLILQAAYGIDPLIPGSMIAAESVAWSLCSILVSTRPSSTEPIYIRAGVILSALGAAGLVVAVPSASLIGIGACVLIQGGGFGLCWPFILKRMIAVAPSGDQVSAGTATPAILRIGYAVGAAATGFAANAAGLSSGLTPIAARSAGLWVFLAFVPLLVVAIMAACGFTKSESDSRAG